MMSVLQPPPPPPMTLEGLTSSVQTLMARVAALEEEQHELREEIKKLQAQVKVLEDDRQWWQRWHLKWGKFFRAWRDGTPVPSS